MASDLKNQLATKANGNSKPANSPERTIRQLLERMGPEIKRALPKHMDADRLARIAMTTIRTTPKLLECDATSLMGAVMMSAQLGLEPGILGHCYIIPYGREATFILGYRGMIDLARRSGNIESIQAHEVYDNDFFEMEYGLDEKLRHIPWHLREDADYGDPGDVRGAYMVAKFRDGGYQIHYMPIAEIEAHRKRSRAANNGPWKSDYIEMCKKTVVRSAWKWLPISVEIMRQVEERDDTVSQGVGDDGMINVTPGFDTDGDPEERRVEPPEPSAEDDKPQAAVPF